MSRGGFFLSPVKNGYETETPPDAGKDAGKLDCSYAADKNVKWKNHSGKQLAVSLKT